jgi:putative transposase
MTYQITLQNRQEFPVVVMCRVLGVSESGFYAWRKRPACQRKREDAQVTQEIEQAFVTHQGRYGSPRIHRELRDQGRNCSRKRVAQMPAGSGTVRQTQKAPGDNDQERRDTSCRSQCSKS